MFPATFLRRFSCFHFALTIRTALVLFAAILLGSALSARPGHAQYMYLDSNGDGVHTDADVLTATGTTQAKIYLRTNKRRDGSDATCPTEGILSMISYEVCLRAVGGTVTFSNATNLQTGMGLAFGNFGNDSEYYIGYAGSNNPPGDYLLAQVLITVASGTPSIEIVEGVSINPPAYTSFGSNCVGLEYDNTIKLGAEWFDVDGLAYSGGGGTGDTPLVSGPASLVVRTGEAGSADFGATDPDGDYLTLSVAGAPEFVSIATLSSAPGNASARVHAFPLRGEAGTHDVTVSATDGVHVGQATLRLEVQAGPDHPPTIRALAPIRVEAGMVASARLEAVDTDGDPASFRLIAGPDFAAVSTQNSGHAATTGRLLLHPGVEDVGAYSLRIGAATLDGEAQAEVHVEVVSVATPAPPLVRAFGANFTGLASADFNEDGLPDIAGVDELANYGVGVYLGDGAGGLSLSWKRTIGFGYIVAEAADWDGDGHADLAIGAFGGLPLSIFWGRGDGTMSDPTEFQELSGVTEIRAADFNEDGIMDLAASNHGMEIYVLLGTSSRSLGPLRAFQAGEATQEITVGDFNRDGRLDLVAGLFSGVGVLYGFGDGTFGPNRSIWAGRGTFGLVPGDWNEDGILDLVSMRSYGDGGVGIFLGDADGGFHASDGPGNYFYGYEIAAGDWNGDGHLDLLPTGDPSRILFGSGAGAFAASTVAMPGGTYDALFVDLNADGRLDAVSAGTLTAVLNGVATVSPAVARAFLAPPQHPIPVSQTSGSLCVRLEPVGGSFSLADLDAATLRLLSSGTGSASEISAGPANPSEIGDSDHNGVSEYPACFAMSDVSRLFSLLRGKQEVTVQLKGTLTDGRPIAADITFTIIGKGTGALVARVDPNPLNPEGVLRFTSQATGPITIRLFDVNGRMVRSLWNARVSEAGPQEVRIDGHDDSGRALRSGVYFYRIDGAGFGETGRFTILK